MEALGAGKHVLVEKPYSADPADVEAAFDLAAKHGLVVAEALMWRHGPAARLITELLPQVGNVLTIRTSFSFALTWATDVRLDKELAGGSLMDVGCYSISGARLAAGADPVRVFGTATWGPTGVDRRFHGELEFATGAVAQIMCGFDTERTRHRGDRQRTAGSASPTPGAASSVASPPSTVSRASTRRRTSTVWSWMTSRPPSAAGRRHSSAATMRSPRHARSRRSIDRRARVRR